MVARCRNAIDYTRPIDDTAEMLILNRLELEDTMNLTQLLTNERLLGGDACVTNDTLDIVMPWMNENETVREDEQQGIVYKDGDIKSKIEALKLMAESK